MAQNMQQFEQMIAQLLSIDNNVRGQAEALFNETKKTPDFLALSLLSLVRASGVEEVKVLCCVLLRRIFRRSSESLWPMLNSETQARVKQQILEAIDTETNPKVCIKLGDIAAEIAGAIVHKGQWNELMPFLFNCSKSEQDSKRETALSIFAQLAPELEDQMRPHFALLKDVLANGLNDPKSLRVRLSALTATANFLQVLTEPHERSQFQQLIPLMLGCVSAALNAQQEEEARSALELFVDLGELDPTFLRPSLQTIVSAMLTIATASNLEDSTRHLGVEFLITLAENKPGMIKKVPNFVENLVPVLLKMMLQLEDDETWYNTEEDDEVDITDADVGEESLDRLALALGQAIVPTLFQILPSFFTHQDWRYRHTALMVISIIGEGCKKALEPNLREILNSVTPFFQDSHPRVRWAACNTCGQMATDYGPTFQLDFHAQVLPPLIAIMDDSANPKVQSHAASAVINFCENCDPEVLTPYLDSLLTKLLTLLQTGKTIVQEQVVTALAAVADCIKTDFIKYYDTVVPLLKAVLSGANAREHRTLRGKAMECITLIGVAVGKEKFANDAKEIMELLTRTQSSKLESDDPQIPFLLQAWARICRCLGQDFVPYLPLVMPPLLQSAQISPDVTITSADQEQEYAGYDFIPVGDHRVGINTSALEEKSTACNMLFCYATELEEGFFPYVDQVAKLLVPLMRFYYHDGVRSAAVSTMPHLLISAKKYFEKAGAASGADQTYLRNLWGFMFPTFMESLKEEPDLEMVVTGLEVLIECLQALGDNCLDQDQMTKSLDLFFTLLKDIKNRRRERNTRRKEEDHDEDEEERISEEEERDQEILSQLAEYIGHILKYCKHAFLPYFQQLVPHINELLKPQSQASDRQCGLCFYCDLVDYIGPDSVSYFSQFLTLMLQYSLDPDAAVRQAAVYGLGCCAQHGGDHIKPAIPDMVARLTHVISQPDSRSEANSNPTENAISAVTKIILYQGNAIDMQSVVPTWLSWLPVTVDKIESKVTYANLCTLVESSNPHVLGENLSNVPKLVKIFGYIVGTQLVDDAIQQRIARILKQMQTGLPANIMQSAWASLSPEEQQKLQQFMATAQ